MKVIRSNALLLLVIVTELKLGKNCNGVFVFTKVFSSTHRNPVNRNVIHLDNKHDKT